MDAWYFQDALPLFSTQGDKIGAAGAIVIRRKTIGISSGMGFRIKAALCHPAPLVLFLILTRRPLATLLAGDHKGPPYLSTPPSPLRITRPAACLRGFSIPSTDAYWPIFNTPYTCSPYMYIPKTTHLLHAQNSQGASCFLRCS